MADKLEALAAAADTPAPNCVDVNPIDAAADTPEPTPAPGPEPEPRPAPEIKIKRQARAHSKLAIEILSRKSADLHRAYSIWCAIDRQDKTWFYQAELLTFVSENWDSDPRNVRRWLAAGEGLLWTFGKSGTKTTISFFGKNRVLTNFEISKPGKVQLIETELLQGRLQQLRANLFACVVEKQSKWASRETLREITNIEPRTQRNYNQLNGQKRQTTFVIGWKNDNGGNARQMPNRYHRLHYTGTKSSGKRYNLHTLEPHERQQSPGASKPPGISVKSKVKRLLYDNATAAVRAISRRGEGHTFSVLPSDKPSNTLLLRAYGVA